MLWMIIRSNCQSIEVRRELYAFVFHKETAVYSNDSEQKPQFKNHIVTRCVLMLVTVHNDGIFSEHKDCEIAFSCL